jgi:hypothetical protein
MFMGSYEFSGDAAELLGAYDRLMEGMPPDGLLFHACVATADGIRIYDCCPSQGIFAGVSSSPELLEAIRVAGLPAPTVRQIGEVHVARIHDVFAD